VGLRAGVAAAREGGKDNDSDTCNGSGGIGEAKKERELRYIWERDDKWV
jgi:hypothetical protein